MLFSCKTDIFLFFCKIQLEPIGINKLHIVGDGKKKTRFSLVF